MWFAALLIFAFDSPQQPVLSDLLSRVAEEAEILRQNAPKALTQETLEQRALMPPSRFHPRIGKGAAEPAKPRLMVREIVSEYSVGKRMLEDFARHGLVDLATDYGIILLAFSKRLQANLETAIEGESLIGADEVWVIDWKQRDPEAGMLEFRGNQAARRTMEGRLMVRKSDGLPLRIEAWTQHDLIRDDAIVDYVQSPHGFVAPVSVLHHHIVNSQLITENHYRYEPFKMDRKS